VKKVDALIQKKGAKRYKKFMLIKKFSEDEDTGSNATKAERATKKKVKQDMMDKYSLVLKN
jgi:hypothetical protein